MILGSCSLNDVFSFFNGDRYSVGARLLSDGAFKRAASCCNGIGDRESSLVAIDEITVVVGDLAVAVASLLPIASFSRFSGGDIAFGLGGK